MEAIEIVKELKEKKDPYNCAVYLLKKYRDLRTGKKIIQDSRKVLDLMDEVIEKITDDEYIDIINYHYKKGYTADKTAKLMNIEVTTFYRQRRRITQRVAVILYGDEALL